MTSLEPKKYPVLRLDLNAEMYDAPEGLHSILNSHLCRWEERYGQSSADEDTLPRRFAGVIRRAQERTGRRVVVLIDDCDAWMQEQHSPAKASPEGDPQDVGREYDKPLLSTIGKPELHEAMKGVLKVYSVQSRLPLVALRAERLDADSVTVDVKSLLAKGSVRVGLHQYGGKRFAGGGRMVLFRDRDGNGTYADGIDQALAGC